MEVMDLWDLKCSVTAQAWLVRERRERVSVLGVLLNKSQEWNYWNKQSG